MTKNEFGQDKLDILNEFIIDEGVLYEYPNISDLIDEIYRLRAYRAWAIRTRCGDRLEVDKLVPAGGGAKKIPKRHFDDPT